MFHDVKSEGAGEAKESKLIEGKLEFEKHCRQKLRRIKIGERVKQDESSYEKELNERRERLRRLILEEEESLIKEVVDQAQQFEESRFQKMQERAETLKRQQQQQRLALASAKRMQQYLNRCPEVRQMRSRKLVVDAKESNLLQMAENQARKQSDRELDHLWHELMLKEVEAKKNREVQVARQRSLVERDTLTTLNKQISGKLLLEERRKVIQQEEKEYLEELWENMRQEAKRKCEREKLKRRKLRMELEEQMTQAQKRLLRKAQEEREEGRALNEQVAEELRKERMAKQKSLQDLRREVLAYMMHLEDLREEEAKREIELNHIIEKSMSDPDSRRELAIQKHKEAKARQLEEVLQGRQEQIQMKREADSRTREQEREEQDLLEKQLEVERKLIAEGERREREERAKYAVTLKEQWKDVDLRRRQEREEDIRMFLENLKKEEVECEKLTEELLNASENVTPHPFRVFLQQYAERNALEKIGQVYCPPVPSD